MRTRLMRIAMIACIALTASAGLSACQGGESAYASNVDYCTIMADPPVKAGTHMAGPGRYRCDGVGPTTLKITVMVEKKLSATKWRTVASQTWVLHGANTTRLRSETTRTRDAMTSCATGQYRTAVHTVETSRKNTADYDTHSVTVTNPCRI